MTLKRLTIGTRGSRLALWQAEWVRSRIREMWPGCQVSLVKIKTSGDRILDVPLAQVGGKGLFVKEIEEAMLREEIDIAVHSMKDVPFPSGPTRATRWSAAPGKGSTTCPARRASAPPACAALASSSCGGPT